MSTEPSSLAGARSVSSLPRFVQPELATLVDRAPSGGGWLHEVKFDGYRALARIENGSVEIYSRNDKDWTSHYQVLAEELAKLPVENAMLDGEVVAQLPDGTTSFQALVDVLGRDGRGTRRGGHGQLLYYVFDLMYLNGFELFGVTIEERKVLLKHLLSQQPEGGRILFSDHVVGGGENLISQACALGLEGIVSKKSGAPYRPGVRGSEWVKTKCRHEQEFVIGGFTDPGGARVGFGALLLGVNGAGGLRYVGKVGTGFNDRLLRRLGERLRALEVDLPPFAADLERAPKGVHWVRPVLVAEVSFAEWTRAGGVRHPSFKGLREDKPAGTVVAEE
ncbi:MAG: hypothetical protein A2133_07580 [Actinobacteria bacterium RBG_16_64_13]|nr:MAG: hypothetical protein A2133_07580 [Actinobacteria bacterium RBG_16_64_13]